jgi:hypothetical protein
MRVPKSVLISLHRACRTLGLRPFTQLFAIALLRIRSHFSNAHFWPKQDYAYESPVRAEQHARCARLQCTRMQLCEHIPPHLRQPWEVIHKLMPRGPE